MLGGNSQPLQHFKRGLNKAPFLFGLMNRTAEQVNYGLARFWGVSQQRNDAPLDDQQSGFRNLFGVFCFGLSADPLPGPIGDKGPPAVTETNGLQLDWGKQGFELIPVADVPCPTFAVSLFGGVSSGGIVVPGD